MNFYVHPQLCYLIICFVTLALAVLFGFLLGTIFGERRSQSFQPKRRLTMPRW